ncbi:hypothetical protein [Sphingobium sp. MK2]|uniref:hypothetical protein n=1 Tax=Sphingobium sp. MK2 TaxID=3116540 RepID=UPI0032E3621A
MSLLNKTMLLSAWRNKSDSFRMPKTGNTENPQEPTYTTTVAGDHEFVSTVNKRKILAERDNIHADFTRTAHYGHVPADALIWRLHANHCDELAEDRRELKATENALDTHLRRLDALFPAPVPPEPEPPRGRVHRRISTIWPSENGASLRH